MSKNLKRNW